MVRLLYQAVTDAVRQGAGEWWATVRGGDRSGILRDRDTIRPGGDAGRTQGGATMWNTLWQDMRFAVRTMAARPGFTAAVIVTIGLGVGATTSIFTVVNGVVLRPLPFPDSERVVMLCEPSAKTGSFCGASPMNVADWVRMGTALESAGVARGEGYIAQIAGETFGVRGGIASPGFFEVIRLRPEMGRLFEESDMDRGSNYVVLVSRRFWEQRLGADPAIVGRAVMLDGVAFTVVGVLPADAFIPRLPGIDVWKPLTASVDDVEERSWRGFTAIGRMADGVGTTQLGVELETLRARLEQAYPEDNAGWSVHAVSLRQQLVGDTGRALWIFLAAVGLVLLIACANVASLFMVRATSRSAEFAVRASLGATRRRLLQQLLTESLFVSVAGGAAGLVLAIWATRAFLLLAPASIPRLSEVSIDARVAAFAFTLSALSAVFSGIASAGRATHGRLSGALGGTRQTQAAGGRMRSGLVVVELALALMLLVGAGLLARSFRQLLEWEPGFDRSGLAVSWMLPPGNVYKTAPELVGVMERARAAVASVPGVRSAGLSSGGPLFGGGDGVRPLTIEGRAGEPDDEAPPVEWYDVDAHYFGTLGLAIVQGRDFAGSDSASAPAVAVVNETLARRFFPSERPVGRRVTVGEHTAEIVGVVADTTSFRPDQPTPPQIYWPIEQYPRGAAYLIMRAAEVDGLEKTARARVADVDPRITLTAFMPLEDSFERGLTSPRFNATLVGVFAVIAVTLAAIGVFGVVAYTVASRTREIGVRLALGATPGGVVRQVVRRSMTLAAAGIALGLAGALAAGRLLESLLYGLPPRDVPTLLVTMAVFTVVALAACWLPARRAARINPISALRME